VFFDKGAPSTVLPFSGDRVAVTRAVRGVHGGRQGDWPKRLPAAFQAARRLHWNAAASKTLILLTAAPSDGGIDPSLLDWAEDQKIALTVMEPTNAFTESRRRGP
jgi:hypothetical protein